MSRYFFILLFLFIYEVFYELLLLLLETAELRLEACAPFIVRCIFFPIEAEMPRQIKFPTSKNLLKDPLLSGIGKNANG